jgi:nitrogenase-associated protein
MANIDFYEKPGCINNTKQKKMLEMYGHKVTAFSILTQRWTKESLRPFFGSTPVEEWFNTAAPRIKSGEVNPNIYNEDSALTAMLEDPLLIRRPLIKTGDSFVSGFKNDLVNELLKHADVSDLQNCPNISNSCV